MSVEKAKELLNRLGSDAGFRARLACQKGPVEALEEARREGYAVGREHLAEALRQSAGRFSPEEIDRVNGGLDLLGVGRAMLGVQGGVTAIHALLAHSN